MGNLPTLTILASVLVDLIVAGLVLLDSPQRTVNRLFLVVCGLFALFGISFIGFNFKTNIPVFWASLYLTSIFLLPPVFYHLTIGSIGKLIKDYEPLRWDFYERIKHLAYVFSLGWLILMMNGLFSPEKPKLLHNGFLVIGNQVWIPTLFYMALAFVSVFILARQTLMAKDRGQRSRLLYLLIGAAAILLGSVVSSLIIRLTALTAVQIVPWAHMAFTLLLLLIAYSLTTSHLYHFSELLRKTMAFLVLTGILLLVFGGTHFVASQMLVPYIPNSEFFALGMSSIIMALAFHPLRFRVQNFVDRIFFAQKYDQMQRLRGLSRRVLSSAEREELLSVLFSSLRSIGFGSASLLLKDPQKSLFHIKKAVGLSPETEGFFLKADSLLIQHLREGKEELIRDEVTRRVMTDWERQAIADEMEMLQAEICFPLFSTRRRALFGVLTLGKSDLGYSSYKGRNIFWLKAVIENAGIMLDNFYHQDFANALVPYVGRVWANEMRRNKDGFRERLAGHRTWVSIIMVDIRHFTNMSARMDPKDVVNLLKDFRSVIAPVVYRHQGTIDKFIGDAVMIVFGLPILPPLPNPDKNAVDCAKDIMRAVENFNVERQASGQTTRIAIGVGVSSGEVIAGNVDSGDRVEYTVIGDAANMVARLEDLAGDNQILLSPATYDRIKGQIPAKAWPPRKITGFEGPIAIYEVSNEMDAQKPAADTTDKPSSSSQRWAVNQ